MNSPNQPSSVDIYAAPLRADVRRIPRRFSRGRSGRQGARPGSRRRHRRRSPTQLCFGDGAMMGA